MKSMLQLAAVCVLCVAASGAPRAAESPYAPDKPEPGSVEAIASFTTEARFSSPWVAYVPESATVPSPTDHLGHVAGAAGELSSTQKIYGYLRALDAASERVTLEVIGRTEEGREILLVAVADEAGIRDLPRLKEAAAALADPRRTSPEQAEKLIATARPLYYFNAGLHSTETGSPEMVMEMAYRLAVSEQPMIRQIREKVVVLINPVAEPDGRDKVVDWFYRYLKGKTDFEDLPYHTPPYWGHYVFHDNNRDTHQQSLTVTRAVKKMFFDYHPTVMHDLHESIPLLHTWNGTGPYNELLDPIFISEWLEMSFHEITVLTSLGMPGVWTWGFGEGWGQHYLDSLAVNHNAIGRGYETFGNSTAETVERVLRSDEERYVGKPVTEKEWYRVWPPDRKFMWSLRNNTNYMQTGCLAILGYTARNAEEMLRNYYRKHFKSWQKGLNEAPYAYVIPEQQGDRRSLAQMLNLLRAQGIEVSRAASPLKLKEGEWPAGTFVVRLDQPYRNYAVDLLEPQKFPTDTPYEPYDDVSWALPVHYGLEAKKIDDPAVKNAPIKLVIEEIRPTGKVAGSGPVFLLKDTGQSALLGARQRLSGFKVEIAEKPFTRDGVEYPAGSWILASQRGLKQALEQVSGELALDFASASAAPDVARHAAPVPRLALWHTWDDTESVGWVRLALDQEKVKYDYIRDEEIKAGNLRASWDIILFGHVYLDLKGIIHGIDPKHGPLPYTKTPQFPSHGVPDSSADITGGIGWPGMENLRRFIADGGLLVTLANGSRVALDSGMVRDVYRGGGELFTPGVELRAKFTRPDHPLAYGYPEVTSVFRQDYGFYKVEQRDRRFIVMQWGTKLPKAQREDDEKDKKKQPESDESKKPEGDGPDSKDDSKKELPFVVSGGAKGLDNLEGHPAILDLPAPRPGTGRVLAFNFNPIHRDLNHSDYRLVWNAILNWSALPPALP